MPPIAAPLIAAPLIAVPLIAAPLIGAISGVRVWSATRTEEELCEAAGDLCS